MKPTRKPPESTAMPTPNPAQEESSALFLQREMHDIIKSDPALFEGVTALIADALVRGWRKRCGTQRIYIPAPPRNETRDTQIKREFNGRNHEEICRKFSIGRTRLYEIVGKRSG
jgi:Mor family transcriptional regulator